MSKTPRPRPTFEIERRILHQGHSPVAGVDEAGRGPWAGPVVAAAIVLNSSDIPEGIDDSKALTEDVRQQIYDRILASGAHHGIGIAEVDRIDQYNILKATLWAMEKAIENLPVLPQYVLVDGNAAPQLKCQIQTIIQGDSKSLSIAAASILAKVTRDRIMCTYEDQYPGYGFARHKGYGTPEHKAALGRLGLTPLHRRSFKPIQHLLPPSPKT